MPDDHRLARQRGRAEQYADDPSSRPCSTWKSDSGEHRAITPPGATLRVVVVPDAFSVLTSVAAGVGLGVLSEG
jgi:DNA-binding transcriptional LysR family regulator